MEYRILGKTGLKISRMGFGGIPIQKTSAEETKTLIRFLMEQGVNYIDTARGYTVSEEYLGYALEGIRDRFVIATKSMARTKEAMEKDISISMKNLRTDYIDLYQVHNPTAKDLEQVLAPGGALEALQEAKAAGKIGHIGATAHGLEAFERLIREYEDKIETMMFPYSIVENQAAELMKECKEKNIGFISMKPVAGGNIDNVKLALRYILNSPDCTIVIPGMGNAEEVRQNASEEVFMPLSEEDKVECAKIQKELGSEFCRRCGYCAPCPQGINIPSALLFANYKRKYGLAEWAASRYATLDKTASDCVKCGLCETRCPYNLPIRKMLASAAELMGK